MPSSARPEDRAVALPFERLAGGLAALGVVEELLLAKAAIAPPVAVAAVVVAAAPLMLMRRAPLAGLAAALGVLFAVRALGLSAGIVWPALLVMVAAFAGGIAVHPRRVGWLVPIGAAYVALRATEARPDDVVLVFAAARYAAAAGGGVMVRRRLARVAGIVAERDALRRAVEAGPGEAVAAEQLRVWSAVQPRTDRVVAELPAHADLAARALREDPEAAVRHLEAIRVLALEAFEEMRATVGALDPPSGPPAAVVPVAGGQRVRSVLDASLDGRRAGDGALLAGEVAGSLERFIAIVGRREEDARELRARVRRDELRLTLRLARGTLAEEDLAALRLLGGRVRLQGGRLEVRRGALATRIVLALPAGRAAGHGGDEGRSGRPWQRLPAPGPLTAICAVLVAGALAEQAVFELPGPAVLAWGVAATFGWVPLLAPRWPLAAAAATALVVTGASAAEVMGGYTTTQNFVAAVVVAVAGATAPPRHAALALALVVAGMMLGLWLEPSPWPFPAYAGLFSTLLGAWAAGIILRRVATAYRRAREQSREAGAALADLERQAVLGERVRLAGELHDLVGHALTSIVVQAAGASAQAARGRPQAAASIAALAGAADLAVLELGRLARVLEVRPGGESGSHALAEIVARARRAGQTVRYEADGPLDDLPPQLAHALERIVQESLTNAAKHAAGAGVEVAVHVEPQGAWVRARIANGEGRAEGFGVGGGHGLRSMRERARRCGGDLEAGPAPEGGWVVTAGLGALATDEVRA